MAEVDKGLVIVPPYSIVDLLSLGPEVAYKPPHASANHQFRIYELDLFANQIAVIFENIGDDVHDMRATIVHSGEFRASRK